MFAFIVFPNLTFKMKIDAKVLDSQQYPCDVEGGRRAAALKGSMNYAFAHVANFLLLLLLANGIWASKLWFEPQGSDMGS